MRVGEILLANGWVDPTSLQRALAEQRHTGKRLCSLLIGRGLLDPDHASRALGEQHGVAAVLQRHLEHRDRALAMLLPGALARANFALPIGRSRTGELIVCVRDPRPEVHAAIQQAIGGKVIVAVSPASQLESLIDMTYDPVDDDEIDVDLTTGPIATIDQLEPQTSGPIAVVGESLPGELSEFSLVGLDDLRVAKDPSQIGSNLAPSISRTMTATPPVTAARTSTLNRSVTPRAIPIVMSLDQTIAALANAPDQARATELAMRFAQGRWAAALLFTIKEGAALGHRGHGQAVSADAIQAVAIPLTTPTIVKLAHDTRRLATETPANAGAIQERLARMLAVRTPTAAPILVANRVAGVLAVGEPIGDPDDGSDLDYLASALGDAYLRILRE
jgi:hypothetical protein